MKNKLKSFKRKYLTTKTAKLATNVLFFALTIVLLIFSFNLAIKIIIETVGFLTYIIVLGMVEEFEKEKDALPIVKERFTKKRPDGSIGLDTDRFQEAILYLYEVEDKLYK